MTRDTSALPRLLSELSETVPAGDVAAVEELQRRVDRQVLRLLVVGEAKRGKSTLINALIGRDVLPSGVVPLTAVATTVVHGEDEGLLVQFANGQRCTYELAELPSLVTEKGNPANRRGVVDVVAHVSAPFLEGGVELVDTPGVGSIHAHNTDNATEALAKMDAAIFVLTVDPPISDSERAFLRDVRENAVTVLCVLNKVDRLSAEELTEARAFTEQVLSEELGTPTTVWPVSARAALHRGHHLSSPGRPDDDSFAELEAALRDYLSTSRAADLTRSVASRAERLARSVAETNAATLAALALSQDELDGKLRMFEQQLAAVGRARSETQAVAASELRRLLTETNEQAAVLRTQTEPPLLETVKRRLDHAEGSMRQTEDDALACAGEEIRSVVEGWRTRRAKELDAAVADLDQRLSERLHGHIRAVRDAASTLFAMDLPPASAPAGLSGTTRFSYRFAADPGQLDALSASMRRQLPATIARRQVTTYVLSRGVDLLDKHIGRARADFQDQLAETRRRLLAELDRRFDEAAGRVADAVTQAGRIRHQQAGHVEALRRQASAGQAHARQLAEAFAAVPTNARPTHRG